MNNTIIVFSADNGHEIYYSQKNRCEKPYRNLQTGLFFDDLENKYRSRLAGDIFNGNAGMAGLKRSNLEGGVRVPLVFYCPGIIPCGNKSNALVTNYDFLPTVADLLNVKLLKAKDGRSYKNQLINGIQESEHQYIVFSSNTGPAIVTEDGWKLRYQIYKNRVELFFLQDDPFEIEDLSLKYPKKVQF